MKKLGALLFAIVAFSAFSFGQYFYIPSTTPGNPGGLNNEDAEFPVGGGLPTTWTTLLPGNNAVPVWSSNSSIPFPFNFNGSPVTDFKVSSTGVLTFDLAATAVPPGANAAIPNASIPDNSVMIWGIEGTGSNDEIVLQTFGAAPNRQHWVFFSSYTESSWSYWAIVLEETTDKIYVVDMRHGDAANVAVTVGIQIDASTAYAVAGSPAVGALAMADATDADNYYYEFNYGTAPSYDFAGIDITLGEFLLTSSAPFTITGNLTNLGSQTITSYDINYSIDGGAPVTAAATGSVMVPSYATTSFSSSIPWTPSGSGSYMIEAWATNLNGNPDEVPSNDKVSLMVNVVDTFAQILPLYETFTSSTCPPCVPANTNMEALFAANPGKYVSIKYQMSWPGTGDPYYTDEGGERRDYYAVNSVPRMEILGEWDQNGNDLTQSIMDEFYAKPAFVTIDATFTQDDAQGVDVDVSINPLVDLASTSMVMHVAVLEAITYNNTGSNGETEFHSVMKKMLPGAGGTSLAPFTAGNVVTADLNWVFQGAYNLPPNATAPVNHANEHTVEDFNNLQVIVWVQDNVTKQILQSAYAEKVVVSTGIETPQLSADEINLFPNPAVDAINIQLDMEETSNLSAGLYTATGQLVQSINFGLIASGSQTLQMQLDDIAYGMYHLHLVSDRGSVLKPIMIGK